MKEKNIYWQSIRGICILAVIMIHCPTGQEYSLGTYNTWIILRQIINFPVAIFIFLAGYFVNTEKIEESSKRYLMNRGGRLLVPYLIWSSVYILKNILFSGITIKTIIYELLLGKAVAPFYYIIVLIQLTIITPWLVKYRKCYMYLITPLYLVIIYYYNMKNGNTPMFYETLFPAWFSFYMLGLDCKKMETCQLVTKEINLRWIIITLFISVVEAFALLKIGCSDSFASSQIKISSYLYVVAIIFMLLKYQKKKSSGSNVEKILVLIGNYSYGIFFVHMLVLFVVEHVLRVMKIHSNWIIYFVMCFAFTAIGSIGIIKVTRKITFKLHIEKVLYLLGF